MSKTIKTVKTSSKPIHDAVAKAIRVKANSATAENVKAEHRTTESYVVGFLLSLVFTIIPYRMVTSHNISGTTLLTWILGFAFLQMAVQIFFFLHLGRGPKPLYNVVFFFATFGAILVVVVGSVFIMAHLHDNMNPMSAADTTTRLAEGEGIYQVGGEKTGACPGVHAHHRVTITNGVIAPAHTHAQLCDTLTIINQDDTVRNISFGPHDHHEVYAGEEELTVHKGYPTTFTLDQPGTHLIHDHLDPNTAGDFTVSP
jgi:cytochrome o ubiquinol oxidase operon protein cyoD